MQHEVSWWELARCRGRIELFYIDEPDQDTIDDMRALCTMCPVQDKCEAAGEDGSFGDRFYAGMTWEERKRKRRVRSPKSAQAAREREAIHRHEAVVLDLLVLAEVPGEQFAEIVDAFCRWTILNDPAWTYDQAQERAFLIYERLQAKVAA